MPRPVFGQVDWWTFRELDDPQRFSRLSPAGRQPEVFSTHIADVADDLALSFVDEESEEFCERRDTVNPPWRDLEFCVSRGTKTLLAVRRRS